MIVSILIATSWDNPLSSSLLSWWECWRTSLTDLSNGQVARCYKPIDFGGVSKAEIHNFSDANTSGYGCVSYLYLVNTCDKVHCVAQFSQLISAELKLNVQIDNPFWTDSQVVLGYLRNTSNQLHVYVSNRSQQVRDNCDPESCWCHVPTGINPADHASKGLTANQPIKSNWFTGPQLLWDEPIQISIQQNCDVILPPPTEFTDSNIYCRKHWHAVQDLANEFWPRWPSEYLLHLQTRKHWRAVQDLANEFWPRWPSEWMA